MLNDPLPPPQTAPCTRACSESQFEITSRQVYVPAQAGLDFLVEMLGKQPWGQKFIFDALSPWSQ